ncbi:hypothetical protein, partial [uncultured Rikenella sp.]|uniref:hypothetical protein n=1 Tax=uncultured Rikenella sp. TaxID=368003 RepID=UPI0025E5540C
CVASRNKRHPQGVLLAASALIGSRYPNVGPVYPNGSRYPETTPNETVAAPKQPPATQKKRHKEPHKPDPHHIQEIGNE